MSAGLAAGDLAGVKNAPANAASDHLLHETLRVFQPRTSRDLTHEDARQIRENLTGFFRVLMEWDARASDGTTPQQRTRP